MTDSPPSSSAHFNRQDSMTATDPTPTYLDASASVDDRVADLLALHDARREARPARQRLGLPDRRARTASTPSAPTPLLRHGIGHITRISGASSLGAAAAAALANEIQQHLVDHTRLGIPAIVHEEICSGLMAREATMFPQALGVAAHVPARAQPGDRRRHPAPDALDGCPPGAVAGARHLPRPALGAAARRRTARIRSS